MIYVTDRIRVDEDELEFSFVRGSGPGGQKVNRTASAVQLRFNALAAKGLSEPVKSRLFKLHDSRICADGTVLISACEHRSQLRNREEAVARLCELLRRAARPPKKRRPTRVSKSQQRKRVESKRKKSDKKKMRRPPPE